MKIILNGSLGRVGNELQRLCDAGYHGTKIAAYVDINNTPVPSRKFYNDIFDFTGAADCIIDFSHHSATKKLTDYAVERRIPLVIATTGHTAEELAMIEEASKKVAIFHSANMSVGVAVLVKLAKSAAAAFPDADIEIIEKHHNRKLDVPSGTALMLANAIKLVRRDAEFVIGRHENGMRQPQHVGIHAVRMGNIIGEHEVIIGTDSQTITLKHEAHSRALFAEGAITAAEFMSGKKNGLYNMEHLLGDR
ncbi:MAG: 4-hydroxy-tetrahydrodipicolinate reductase [Clostridia bacterium]|nr:4-hydroxy-tetrahydrodipicolinate reductase [Clostridia bacterium]